MSAEMTPEEREKLDELMALILIVKDPETSIEQKADAYVKMAALAYVQPPAV
jgi:hypothetical protein